ncbi:MAG: DUF4838 domain-containing protein [Methylacidiphilales bacterium]|nr:DUF4838 domain-containing protein [Candidatus Methylacidiphilales bacterium]
MKELMKIGIFIKTPCLRYFHFAHMVFAVLFCIPFLAFAAAPGGDGTRVTVASDGQTAFKIVVSPTATDEVKKHAADLGDMLGKITGAKFVTDVGDGREGIAVGKAADFPKAPVDGRFNPLDPLRRDEYIIKTHAKGVWLVGISDIAVGHAVWDFLYRLGYRQYFAGSNWEIIPAKRNLDAAMDVFSTPSYVVRDIHYQFGTFPENYELYKKWCVRNRIKSGFVLRNAHMYNVIVAQNKLAFAVHPEYYALWKGVRNSPKLCISNPELRKFVVDFVLRYFKERPNEESCSLEPTDGDGWCECEECAKLGAISNRTTLLANECAAAVRAEYGTSKYIGMLSYFRHSVPPTFSVDPQVIVSACTRMSANIPVDERISGWQKQGAKVGIYDYYSVTDWHRDLPSIPGGSCLDSIAENLPRYYREGARFFQAESGDNWAPCGLGYYLASRYLWDVSEAGHAKELRYEFLNLCFKAASKPLGEFYRLLDGGDGTTKRYLQLDDFVGRMYQLLDEGRKLEADPGVQARIDDLIQYTHYVELFQAYAALQRTKAPRQKEFEELIKYIYRIRGTCMVHGWALTQSMPMYEKDVTLPPEAATLKPIGQNPWRGAASLSSEEITQILENGIKANSVLPFKAAYYSKDLVPAAKVLHLPTVSPGKCFIYGCQNWFTWLDPNEQRFKVSAPGAPGTGFKIKLSLYALNNPIGYGRSVVEKEFDFPKASASASKKVESNEINVEFVSPYAGLHRLAFSWLPQVLRQAEATGVPWTIDASANFVTSSDMYFYVPRGTKIVAGCAIGAQGRADQGVIKDPMGNVVFQFNRLKEEIVKNGRANFQVPVPPHTDGSLWKMEGILQQRNLLNVPPYYARSAEELLLPMEVVERDAKGETK